MKDSKIVKKDPIKDKYTKKISFFKKIEIKCNNIKMSIKRNSSLREEIDSGASIIASIALYGLLGALSISLFGIQFSLITFLSTGSILWLIENKFIGFITQILSSIKIVEIQN